MAMKDVTQYAQVESNKSASTGPCYISRMLENGLEVHNPHSRKSYKIGTPIDNFQKPKF